MSKMTPPSNYVRHYGHHWLEHECGELMVAQWNPGSATWTHSNAHDTAYGGILSVDDGWKWLQHIPLPTPARLQEQEA